MGFFSSIFRAVGRGLGKVVEKAGEVINSDTLRSVGWDLQDRCAKEISNEKSYDKNTANIYSTERLNEILTSFSTGIYRQADSLEKSCIREVERYLDVIIKELESSTAEVRKSSSLRRLKNTKSQIKMKINGAIKNPVARRMSLDDSECLRILKMDAGREKQKAMADFSQKIINEAVDNLAGMVRESLKEQFEEIEDYLTDLCEEREKHAIAVKKQYDEMLTKNLEEEKSREESCLPASVTLKSVEMIEKLLSI